MEHWDRSYCPRSRTPLIESFSTSSRLDKFERHRNKHGEGSSHRSWGNDAMSKALRQISKSPFVRRIDGAKPPHRFTQPMFSIYNGRTDHVEHVSHFN